MPLRVGIVGLPNVGKSTLFNALCGAALAQAANYPFCTIEPNVGVVPVIDDRLRKLAALVGSRRAVPTTLEFVDIAGLVSGASRGEGLGNQFLAHIREVDAVAHVLRCFDDPDVVHVRGGGDPRGDREVVELELVLKDLESVERRRERAQKSAKAAGKPGELARAEVALLDRVHAALARGVPVRAQDLDAEARAGLADLSLLTAKPLVYIANVDEAQAARGLADPRVAAVRDVAEQEGHPCVVLCGKVEAELAELPEAERGPFLESIGLGEPGLERLVRACYHALRLITFFTANENECHAWTVPVGTRAPKAAGAIHGDFERGFIRAEVIPVQELFAVGGEAAARERGLLRVEGKDYVLQDGDLMHVRFAV